MYVSKYLYRIPLPIRSVQVQVTTDDIILQGDSLREYLSTYFVDPRMKLLEESYWSDAGYAGYEMRLKARHCHTLATLHALS